MKTTAGRSRLMLAVVSLVAIGACQPAPGTPPPGESVETQDRAEENAQSEVACEEPRPRICTREYRPVCGRRDTGIRCITTPCPATEWKTFGNACTACRDPEVLSYVPGACRVEGPAEE